MVRRMPGTSRRRDVASLQFNRRLPGDLAGRFAGRVVVLEFPAMANVPGRTVTARLSRSHVRFSLGTTDEHVARQRTAHATAHIEKLYDELRRGPSRLDHRDIVALSKDIYDLVVAKFDANPGSPDRWAAFKAISRAAREGRIASPPPLTTEFPDERDAAARVVGGFSTATVDAHRNGQHDAESALQTRYGPLADWIIATRGLNIDAESYTALLRATDAAATDAAWRMKRAASGDYAPDPKATRFPELRPQKATRDGPTWDKLIGTWEAAHAARNGAPPTRREWRARVMRFAKWAGVRPADITDDHVRRWRDKRLADGASPATINDGDLTFIRGIYKVAIEERVFDGPNPAQYVRVRGAAARQMRAFSTDEALPPPLSEPHRE